MTVARGTRLGSYEIAAQIGAGGMGDVFRATDTKLGRQVAIETLPSALADSDDRKPREDCADDGAGDSAPGFVPRWVSGETATR